MSDSPAESCAEKLERAGLTPICPPEGCESLRDSPVYEAVCAHQPPLAPIQAMGCYNTQTGEWVFSTYEEIGSDCLKLIQKDPAWIIRNCYCCCP